MIVIKTSADGQHYFVVKSRNGRTLATSETYKTMQSARKGAESVCENTKEAVIVEEKNV